MKQQLNNLLTGIEELKNTNQMKLDELEQLEELKHSSSEIIGYNKIVRDILTDIEYDIKQYELQLKQAIIQLKNSSEYMEFKTIKAKEEQAFIETQPIKSGVYELKRLREKLRDELMLTEHLIACGVIDEM